MAAIFLLDLKLDFKRFMRSLGGRAPVLWLIGVLLWLYAMRGLSIAPVNDELSAWKMAEHSPSLPKLLYTLWFGFKLYRPIATSFLALVLCNLRFDLAWQALRAFNCLLIICSFMLLFDAARRCYRQDNQGELSRPAMAMFWLAIGLSPAAMMVATWFANIFDASCLFFLALGLFGGARGRGLTAGVCLGLAWFCKEAAVFVAPLLAWLYLSLPHQRKVWIRAAALYGVFGAIYWFERSQVVALGSSQDIHRMDWTNFGSTFRGIAGSLWSPGISYLPATLGVAATVLVVLLSKSWRLAGLSIAMLLLASAAYLGAISPDYDALNGPLIHMHIFDPRYFYIPTALLLFALLANGRVAPMFLICVTFFAAAPATWSRYQAYQTKYLGWYQMGLAHPGLTIEAPPENGLIPEEGVYGLKMGKIPNADFRLNAQDGSLTPLRSDSAPRAQR